MEEDLCLIYMCVCVISELVVRIICFGFDYCREIFGTLYKLENMYEEEDNEYHVNSAIKMMICCACSFHWYHPYLLRTPHSLPQMYSLGQLLSSLQ